MVQFAASASIDRVYLIVCRWERQKEREIEKKRKKENEKKKKNGREKDRKKEGRND